MSSLMDATCLNVITLIVKGGHNFLEFLQSLPPGVLEQLYTHPTTCIAICRELPELAQHFLSRVLFVEHPVPKYVVSSWVTSEHQGEQQEACEKLLLLKVWHEQKLPGGLIAYGLNEHFRENFKIALLAQEDLHTSTASLGPDKQAKDKIFLDKYATDRWECILHFLVGSRESAKSVTREVADILLQSGLMRGDSPDGVPSITEHGFHFLLMDTSSQIWYFLQQYLATVESRGMNLVECLTFLLQLSFATYGKDMATISLTDSQQKFLQHLRELGLVYQRKKTSNRFYPTRLAINVVTGQSKSALESKQRGYIVVETNYRVYAYTDSILQVALLGLFSELLYRFPNVVVANITRDSIRQALINGIKARQIINFLTVHAHPQMLNTKPILPPTIVDQICLWELERDRFQFNAGMLYNQFLSDAEYGLLRDYAKDIGVLLWQNDRSRTVVVTEAGHDDVKKFWKRQKKS